MGVAEGLKPVIFEINDSPETSNDLNDRANDKFMPEYRSHRDLFRMLELDKPTRLPRGLRPKWEQGHMGGWKLVRPL